MVDVAAGIQRAVDDRIHRINETEPALAHRHRLRPQVARPPRNPPG